MSHYQYVKLLLDRKERKRVKMKQVEVRFEVLNRRLFREDEIFKRRRSLHY